MSLIYKIYTKIYLILQTFFKWLKNRYDRIRLRNDNFTIITNHCMGGFIYHDLGKCFLSPTINLKITPEDFVEFAKNLKYYISQDVELHEAPDINYPVGKIRKLDGEGYIYIYFVHYKSFEDAVNKWNIRKRRINWDNILIMMTARDGCKNKVLEDFESLDFNNKVCYTSEPYPRYSHCKYARLDNQDKLEGYISDMVNIMGKRAYECNGFDYIKFINKETELCYD